MIMNKRMGREKTNLIFLVHSTYYYEVYESREPNLKLIYNIKNNAAKKSKITRNKYYIS